MEFQQLNKAADCLKTAISQFPIEAKTPDDFKKIEDKIIDVRESLRIINAKLLTLNAVIDSGLITDLPQEDLNKCFSKLNENTTNYLINKKTLKLCYESKTIQDIIYKNAGTKEIQEKVKVCLNKLFLINDKITAKNEKRKELMKKQYQLKLECHHAIYNHQNLLKEEEARKNQLLQEINPNIIHYKEKINRSIFKICTIKRLITNLIASMCQELHDNEELIEMLAKHKDIINLETIIELAHNQNSENS